MSNQICPCDPNCNPKNYEGKTMIYADEGWHNWYFSLKAHPPTAGHREKCYECMEYYMATEAMSFVEMDRSYLEEKANE